MKKLLIIITILFTCNPVYARAIDAEPKLLAIYLHSDWCGNCKILSPKMDEARKSGELDKKDVLFIKFNLTDKTSIHQTIMLSNQLGVNDYLKGQGSSTGYVALLDAQSKKELARFDRDSKVADVINTINDNLEK